MASRVRVASLLMLIALVGVGGASRAAELTHRVWLLDGRFAGLEELRPAGIDGLVLPVGDVEVGEGSCRLTLRPLGDLTPLAGWPVSPLVWASGDGSARGDGATLLSELGPVRRIFPPGSPVIIAARRYWDGLPELLEALREGADGPLEVALPVQDLARHLTPGGWPGVMLTGIAFGNPGALGFPPSTIHDDLAASDLLDSLGAPYRLAIVVAPLASPAPGPQGASLAILAHPSVATFAPSERGDVFTLRRTVSWGGSTLQPGQSVSTEVVDVARYHNDLGSVLRPVRASLQGWDTVGLPPPTPALGMSREAFLAYLTGGTHHPLPMVDIVWSRADRIDLAIFNPTPQASAVSSTGNYLELVLAQGEVLDAVLGEFSGIEYGVGTGQTWRRAASREARSVRLYFTYLPPFSRFAGAQLTFLSPPRSVTARWVLRLGDGTQIYSAVPVTSTRRVGR